MCIRIKYRETYVNMYVVRHRSDMAKTVRLPANPETAPPAAFGGPKLQRFADDNATFYERRQRRGPANQRRNGPFFFDPLRRTVKGKMPTYSSSSSTAQVDGEGRQC